MLEEERLNAQKRREAIRPLAWKTTSRAELLFRYPFSLSCRVMLVSGGACHISQIVAGESLPASRRCYESRFRPLSACRSVLVPCGELSRASLPLVRYEGAILFLLTVENKNAPNVVSRLSQTCRSITGRTLGQVKDNIFCEFLTPKNNTKEGMLQVIFSFCRTFLKLPKSAQKERAAGHKSKDWY